MNTDSAYQDAVVTAADSGSSGLSAGGMLLTVLGFLAAYLLITWLAEKLMGGDKKK